MELGLLFLGVGSDHAGAYPFLGYSLAPSSFLLMRLLACARTCVRKNGCPLRDSIVMWISMNFHVMKWTRERPGAMTCPPDDASVGRESGGGGGALYLPCCPNRFRQQSSQRAPPSISRSALYIGSKVGHSPQCSMDSLVCPHSRHRGDRASGLCGLVRNPLWIIAPHSPTRKRSFGGWGS